ncbi:MAG TPA: tRNA lysidine(34) synthetase TilS [Baekduia sp.]|nr:tRNA lysidine(34) synthetase TilS [Baekduia sp.]
MDGDLLQRVGATGLLPEGEPVVVLLSGGRDSTCLLDVALRLGARVRALHVHHGLRGRSADEDAEHCAQLCAALHVPLHTERLTPPAGGGSQAWARDARYAAAAAHAASDVARIAVGHTATDQVETVLYRLATSPGRRALLGMQAQRGRLVRPLLAAGATRAQTARHCQARGLAWREDPSNSDGSYARTRVRDGLVAALEAVDERAHANVLRTAELLRDEAEVLDEVVVTALAGRDRISRARLAELPPALARLVLRRLAEDATGRLCPRAAGRLGDVLALEAGALDLGDGARAIVESGVVRCARTPPLARRTVEPPTP